MKRLVYVMMALVVLFAANSCKDKKTVPVISTNDSVALEDAENDSTIYGVCGEGTSMHSLELISDAGDTLTVFIDDEQPGIVQGGLLAGDRIALIGYKAQDGDACTESYQSYFAPRQVDFDRQELRYPGRWRGEEQCEGGNQPLDFMEDSERKAPA